MRDPLSSGFVELITRIPAFFSALLDGRGRTPADNGQLVHAVSAKAMHVSLCLRDEESAGVGYGTFVKPAG
jgi:hypothetical protein